MDATLKKMFAYVEPKKLDKAIAAASKTVKPAKVEKFEHTKPGQFNAIALPTVPYEVVKVTDAGKGKLDFKVVGQQVIASRLLEVPVTVEYVTPVEQGKYHAAFVAAIRAEVEK